jgi:hypothetical protein
MNYTLEILVIKVQQLSPPLPHEPKPGRACISAGKSYIWSSHDTDLVTNDPKGDLKAV